MARIATALWIVWAIVVWNVVFDHVIVVAGREYLVAAIVAAHGTGPYARMDDWMRPAIARGLWMATAASGIILLVGFAAIRRASVEKNPADRLRQGSGGQEAGSHVETVQSGEVA
jgi:hypothetical protein